MGIWYLLMTIFMITVYGDLPCLPGPVYTSRQHVTCQSALTTAAADGKMFIDWAYDLWDVYEDAKVIAKGPNNGHIYMDEHFHGDLMLKAGAEITSSDPGCVDQTDAAAYACGSLDVKGEYRADLLLYGDFARAMTHDSHLTDFEVTFTAVINFALSGDITMSAEGKMCRESEMEPIEFETYRVWIFGEPVIFKPFFEIGLEVEADLKAQMQWSYGLDYTRWYQVTAKMVDGVYTKPTIIDVTDQHHGDTGLYPDQHSAEVSARHDYTPGLKTDQTYDVDFDFTSNVTAHTRFGVTFYDALSVFAEVSTSVNSHLQTPFDCIYDAGCPYGGWTFVLDEHDRLRVNISVGMSLAVDPNDFAHLFGCTTNIPKYTVFENTWKISEFYVPFPHNFETPCVPIPDNLGMFNTMIENIVQQETDECRGMMAICTHPNSRFSGSASKQIEAQVYTWEGWNHVETGWKDIGHHGLGFSKPGTCYLIYDFKDYGHLNWLYTDLINCHEDGLLIDAIHFHDGNGHYKMDHFEHSTDTQNTGCIASILETGDAVWLDGHDCTSTGAETHCDHLCEQMSIAVEIGGTGNFENFFLHDVHGQTAADSHKWWDDRCSASTDNAAGSVSAQRESDGELMAVGPVSDVTMSLILGACSGAVAVIFVAVLIVAVKRSRKRMASGQEAEMEMNEVAGAQDVVHVVDDSAVEVATTKEEVIETERENGTEPDGGVCAE